MFVDKFLRKSPSPTALTLCLSLLGCASNVQPAVTQFGTDIVAAQSAETAYINALNQQQIEANTVHALASPTLLPIDATHAAVREQSQQNIPPTYAIPPDAVAAINDLLKPIQAYGQAIQALSGDTAAKTLSTNTTNLAQSAYTLSSGALQPLLKTGVTSAQLNDVATFVNDVGGMIIAGQISGDVKSAAQNAEQPLQQIVATLKQINAYWKATDSSEFISNNAVLLWNDRKNLTPTYDERVALLAIINEEQTPITSSEVDTALTNLVDANSEIATSGPVDSKTQIQSLEQAITDADTAYKSFSTK